MKAMLLAAGRGERMRPLTDERPKPLLPAGGKPLLEYHIDALREAGVSEFVVNVAWLKQSLYDYLGDASRFGPDVVVAISDEGDAALETGGGILHALPLLGCEPFWLVNGDVYTEFQFAPPRLADNMLAHLLLVPNPAHNPAGDFALDGGRVLNSGTGMLTYAGVAVLSPDLFADYRGAEHAGEAFPLAPLLRAAADQGRVSGERYDGYWCDVGTPERLADLDARLR